MILPWVIPLLILGQKPHDLDCRGRFDLQSRVEPMRIFPGEAVYWTLRIAAKGPWKRGPERPSLEEDPSLISAFAIQAITHETPSRFPEGVTGPSGTVWEFSWKLRPLPQEGQKLTYPMAIPEVGFVFTRDDVPWPSLAREIIWVGPFPLSYREGPRPQAPEDAVRRNLAMASWAMSFLIPLVVMLGYEFFWARKRWQKLSKRLETTGGGEALSLRHEFKRLLREAGLVLPEEPGEETIGTELLRAGYGPRLAKEAMDLWKELNHSAFNRMNTDFEGASCQAFDGIKHRVLGLATALHWRFWKRRLDVGSGYY